MIVFAFFTFVFVFLIFASIVYIIYRFGGDIRMLYAAAKITKERSEPIKVVSPVPNNRRKDIINNMYLSMAEPKSPISEETFSKKHLSKIEGDSVLVDENGEIKDWNNLQHSNISSTEDVAMLENEEDNDIIDTSSEREQLNSFTPIGDSFSFPLLKENESLPKANDEKNKENYTSDVEDEAPSEEVDWDKLLNNVRQRLNTTKDNS